jgi:hypothetical protein
MPDVLQVTYEYPGFTLSYESCNLNGHGLGKDSGMAYYNAQDKEDRPNRGFLWNQWGSLRRSDRLRDISRIKPVPPQDLYAAQHSPDLAIASKGDRRCHGCHSLAR